MNMYHGLGGGDPLYPVQPDAKYWHLAEIHHLATGRNMTVAVIDSGVDEHHPDLAGQIALKENFVDGNSYTAEAHGTGVAGIIAARADNGAGIEGIAPNARLMALRACWQSPDQVTRCSSFTLGKALNFAIEHEAQVINLSLTGPADRLLQRLLDAALERGITVVGAFDPQQVAGGFPASYPGVVAVAEQEEAKRVPEGVFMAPGRDIPTTAVGLRWSFVSGSSYAAAHVSGLAALLGELQPHARVPALLRNRGAGGPMKSAGMQSGGQIDACAVNAQAAAPCACSCPTVTSEKALDYR
jgi:subtilisin family serine protease